MLNVGLPSRTPRRYQNALVCDSAARLKHEATKHQQKAKRSYLSGGLVQLERPRSRGSPGELNEPGGDATVVVVGEAEGKPVQVDAPHDGFDIERRPVGRVEVQTSDAALAEPLRRANLGAAGTQVDGLEEKKPFPALHDHGPRNVGSRMLPESSRDLVSPSPSNSFIGVDMADSKSTVWSRSEPCVHVRLLLGMPWDGALPEPAASLDATLATL